MCKKMIGYNHHKLKRNICFSYNVLTHDMLNYLVPRRGDSSLCKHHTYTVFEAMLKISSVTEHVKCITLVYPVIYPNAHHMMCLQSSY